jgi:DNA-binding NarL/FixJ family response regulator
MEKIKICIFDDKAQVRKSFKVMIEASGNFEVTGSFGDCTGVVERVMQSSADVVIMDIEIPPHSGIEAVKLLRAHIRDTPIIMFTVFEDDEKIFDSICAGANGYLLKSGDPGEVVKAIGDVSKGGAPMSPAIARRIFERMKREALPPHAPNYELTARETEVLKHLTHGLSYKMIAAACDISFETVRSHIKNIYVKLHVASSTEAVAKALNEKIV